MPSTHGGPFRTENVTIINDTTISNVCPN